MALQQNQPTKAAVARAATAETAGKKRGSPLDEDRFFCFEVVGLERDAFGGGTADAGREKEGERSARRGSEGVEIVDFVEVAEGWGFSWEERMAASALMGARGAESMGVSAMVWSRDSSGSGTKRACQGLRAGGGRRWITAGS